MNRRYFLLAGPAMLIATASAKAQDEALAAAFEALPPAARVGAQERLAAGGFYTGGIDGAFGPGTKSAIINAAAFVKDNSYGKVVFDLSSTDGAARFLSALTAGDLDKYLWGEGDEADGG
jgi:hypothetical protein